MDQFLRRHNLPKLTEEEIDNLNRPMSIKETESIINDLQRIESTSPNWFTGELYQTFKEEIIPVLYNVSKR